MIRIGIIEDNHVLSENYADFFEGFSDCFIAFQVAYSGALTLAEQQLNTVDVVVLDIPSTEHSGALLLRYLKKELPQARLILFTSRKENLFLIECIKAGADGYLLQTEGLFELYKAIKESLEDGVVLSPKITRQLVNHLFFGRHSPFELDFTSKEKEILYLVKEGLTYKQMAEQLKVTPFTINHHLKKIYKKGRVNSRSQLMVLLQKTAIALR